MKLSEIMKGKKISARELSERTGISKRTIEGYRAGIRMPSFPVGIALAKALGVEPDDLLDEEEKIIH